MILRVFILFVLITISCNEEEALQICNTENPVNNLKWLADFIEKVKFDPKYVSVTISVFEYQDQTVFNIYDVIQSCLYCDLRNCSGQKYTPTDFSDFAASKKDVKKIWCQNPDLCVN